MKNTNFPIRGKLDFVRAMSCNAFCSIANKAVAKSGELASILICKQGNPEKPNVNTFECFIECSDFVWQKDVRSFVFVQDGGNGIMVQNARNYVSKYTDENGDGMYTFKAEGLTFWFKLPT